MCSLVSVVSYLVDSFGTIADWNMLWSKAVGKSKTATHRKELTRMLFLLLFASFFHSFIVYHIFVFCLCAFYLLSLSHTLSLLQFFFTESVLYRWLYTYVYVRSVGRHVSGELHTRRWSQRNAHWTWYGSRTIARIRICVYLVLIIVFGVCINARSCVWIYIHLHTLTRNLSFSHISTTCE